MSCLRIYGTEAEPPLLRGVFVERIKQNSGQVIYNPQNGNDVITISAIKTVILFPFVGG
jgi:hypothetical protein